MLSSHACEEKTICIDTHTGNDVTDDSIVHSKLSNSQLTRATPTQCIPVAIGLGLYYHIGLYWQYVGLYRGPISVLVYRA